MAGRLEPLHHLPDRCPFADAQERAELLLASAAHEIVIGAQPSLPALDDDRRLRNDAVPFGRVGPGDELAQPIERGIVGRLTRRGLRTGQNVADAGEEQPQKARRGR